MKRNIWSRFGLFATLAASILTISATTVSAEVSRVEYFTIQSNTVCGNVSSANQYRDDFMFNINNTSNTPVNVTVYLYKKDGTSISSSGASGFGLSSDFTPGTPVTIDANSTVQYVNFYGFSASGTGTLPCGERPTYGKIVVNSNNGPLLAGGEYQALKIIGQGNDSHWESYARTTVSVNSGSPF